MIKLRDPKKYSILGWYIATEVEEANVIKETEAWFFDAMYLHPDGIIRESMKHNEDKFAGYFETEIEALIAKAAFEK